MSKRATITKILRTLTGQRSLDSALAGWQVKNLIQETVDNEIVFNSRGEGEWRFAKERHYQYDAAGMHGILE